VFGCSNAQPGEDSLTNRFQTRQNRRFSLHDGLKFELKTDRPFQGCPDGSITEAVAVSLADPIIILFDTDNRKYATHVLNGPRPLGVIDSPSSRLRRRALFINRRHCVTASREIPAFLVSGRDKPVGQSASFNAIDHKIMTSAYD
jgi:hypothetical protein